MLSKNSIKTLNETISKSVNTPTGQISRRNRRKIAGVDWKHMALNTTGEQLKIGYIVEISSFDGDKNLFTIEIPSGDDIKNIAVVMTPAQNGRLVALEFSGAHLLFVANSASTNVGWGSTKDSFSAKEGTTFVHLAYTSFFSDTDRVSACFAGRGNIYNGYFKVILDELGNASVEDGAGSTIAGPLIINDQPFEVEPANNLGGKYIWLEAEAVEIGTNDWAITQPRILSGDDFPFHEALKCKVIIGRIIGGVVHQEHHGAMYAIIAGNCIEEGA